MRNFLLFLLLLLSCSCTETSALVSIDSSTHQQTVRNGETLVVVPKLPAIVDSVCYYWENRLIQTQREMPFVLYHKIENEIAGSYKVDYKVYYPNGFATRSITVNVQ